MRHLSVEKYLQQDCQLDFIRNVLVGVSGGADSLCLLDILLRAGYPVIVAHLNHQLRPEAEAELRWVQHLAEERQIPFIARSVDVRGYASTNGITVEDAARELRYRFLFDLAVTHQAQAVAVGHTADDQVETVLMNFLRGSGLNGLKGMQMRWLPNAWSQEIPLVRPLLNSWRADTEQYCQDHHLQYVQDESNQDIHYRRNLLRHEVIPYLEQINPKLRAALARMAQTLLSDQQIVEQAVQAAWEQCVLEQQADWVAFDRLKLNTQRVEIKRQLLRRAMALQHPGLREVDFESVQRALAFLQKPSQNRQCDLTGGMRLLLEGDRVWVADWEANLPGWDWPKIHAVVTWNTVDPLPLPGSWTLFAGWIEEAAFQVAQENSDPFQAFMDMGQEDVLLEIRSRKNGDRYQPLGMENGSVKVSDYMINHKIPRRARTGWPLVCWQGEVVWIPGGAPAHALRVQPGTQRALWLRLIRGELG